jgi:hypothetical protein
MRTTFTPLFILMVWLCFAFSFGAHAEVGETDNQHVAPAYKQINTLKVFIEGDNLDSDYVRRNVTFVNFVNDPSASDVHIIITQTPTGSGGINYILNFYSKSLAQVGNFSLNCISAPNDTQDAKRECITRTLKLGLMPYMNETNTANQLTIQYNGTEGSTPESVAPVTDPWNFWIYRLNANGSFSTEEAKRSLNYNFSFRGDKITEDIKIRNNVYYGSWNSAYKTDGEFKKSGSRYVDGSSSVVYSLAERWSVGMFLYAFQGTYTNTEFSVSLKPAIEYNIFPWEESDKRRFTVGYNAGPEYKDYFETTIFGMDTENLWAQSLNVNFEVIQPWGEIETHVGGSTYFHDLTKNSVTFESDLSFRVTRGLSLNFRFKAMNMHNQLYLPATEASLEDILMGTTKLPSTFELSGGMGIRFQFGSIYNNVVNNRM